MTLPLVFLPMASGRLHVDASSCGTDPSHARRVLQNGWSGTTPAAIHPGWPGRRRVDLRVRVRSSLAQKHHAQSVQACRSGKTAPRGWRLQPALTDLRSNEAPRPLGAGPNELEN